MKPLSELVHPDERKRFIDEAAEQYAGFLAAEAAEATEQPGMNSGITPEDVDAWLDNARWQD
jgi:hypothetical protein